MPQTFPLLPPLYLLSISPSLSLSLSWEEVGLFFLHRLWYDHMTFVWAIADVHTKRLLIIAFCSGQSTRISYISEAVCGRTVRAVKILSLQASLASVYFLTFIETSFWHDCKLSEPLLQWKRICFNYRAFNKYITKKWCIWETGFAYFDAWFAC